MMYIQEGYSPLMMAALMGKTGVLKELVEAGADLNLQNNVCSFLYMHATVLTFRSAVHVHHVSPMLTQ